MQAKSEQARQGEVSNGIEVSRRSVVAGIFVAATASAASAAVDLREQVERDTEALAASLKALHGGDWSAQISHKHGYVTVSRDLDIL